MMMAREGRREMGGRRGKGVFGDVWGGDKFLRSFENDIFYSFICCSCDRFLVGMGMR